MAGGDRLEHGQPHQFGQDRRAGQETKEEDLHRSGSERRAGEPFLEMPKAVRSRNQHFSRHAAVGKRGRARLVLQQKTKREKNDARGGPPSEHGGCIFPSGDPSSTPHTSESCAVTYLMNKPGIYAWG